MNGKDEDVKILGNYIWVLRVKTPSNIAEGAGRWLEADEEIIFL